MRRRRGISVHVSAEERVRRAAAQCADHLHLAIGHLNAAFAEVHEAGRRAGLGADGIDTDAEAALEHAVGTALRAEIDRIRALRDRRAARAGTLAWFAEREDR